MRARLWPFAGLVVVACAGAAIVVLSDRGSAAAHGDQPLECACDVGGAVGETPRRDTPPPPLDPTLTVAELRDRFNAGAERTRIVSLLSPECGYCQLGHALVGTLLERRPAADLEALVVWLPMVDGDDLESARRRNAAWSDGRAVAGWDAERRIADAFASALDLPRSAWDVYLVYPPGVRWVGEVPPVPEVWMHQLPYAPPDRRLVPVELSRTLDEVLTDAR